MSGTTSMELVTALGLACSQLPHEVRQAEQQLHAWHRQPGFYAALASIVCDAASHSDAVRWQAVLYMKNGIDKYWRKQAPNAIGESEKSTIRATLLRCFKEPLQPIALQLAVLIGKAARFDVPRDWPELLPALLEAVQSPEDLVQHRAMLILHHTIKALSSKRLAADRRVFHEMVVQLMPYVLQLWKTHHSAFIQQASNSSSAPSDPKHVAGVPLEKAILSLKVLRKAAIHGLKQPHEDADVMAFFSALLDQAKVVLNLRRHLVSLRELVEKYLVLHLKVLADLLDTHPFSFISLLRPTLEFVCNLCFTPSGEGLLFQRFTIFCLNLLKRVLLCMEYKPPKNMDAFKNPLILEAHQAKQAFFTAQTTEAICKGLISTYLPLSQDDLNLWDGDPEEYVCEDGGDSWKYSFRPCCESAFLTLFHEYRDTLTPILVALVKENSGPIDVSDMREGAVLYKDAVYNAAGLAAFDLYDEIDFDSWLVSGLEAELQIRDSNYRIVRRRAVWLLGQWSGVKLSPELRPKLYQIILPLLLRSEDLVVRLAAAKALKVVLDDFEFSPAEMEPFLPTAFVQLFALLKEVQECDTKMTILNVLSYLIERVGVGIRPLVGDLVDYLPALWDASGEHNMLRCSILSTLVFIVQGLGSSSVNLFSFLLPIIQLATNLKEECSVYLLEDGLDLWMAVLHNTSYNAITQELMQLGKNLSPLLELGSENLCTVMYILQAYTLLSSHEFIIMYGSDISNALEEQISDLQDEGVLMILRWIELVLRTGPPQVKETFRSLYMYSIRSICQGDAYPLLMGLHLSIASRLLLSYPDEFNSLCNVLAQEMGKTESEIAERVLDVWLDKMSLVTQPERKKLLSLALASLLATATPVILDHAFGIFLHVTETLCDITRAPEQYESKSSGAIIDTLMKTNEDILADSDDIDYETEHDARRRSAILTDVINTTNLVDYFQTQMRSFALSLGATKYTEVINNMDVETLANMKHFVSI